MENFKEIWDIYQYSFPKDERRTLDLQKNILQNPMYNLKSIYSHNDLIGFIAMWDLPNFLFFEHFAIKKECRGKGYGTKVLKDLLESVSKNIILEVERPTDNISKKRISFYQRLGFCLNDYAYFQPAYTQDKQAVPLLLMSYPSGLKDSEFNMVKKTLYQTVYKTQF
ncbi:MAG: GNAT family N-acetyltransferase [Clostridia bacterium]|nr:GNAT family N-acetyltransferase [Clostridia bacterium]